MAHRTPIRILAWSALGGQALFVAAWLVAGALEGGYSHLDSGISALAREAASNPGLMIAGFLVLGASLAALGVALAFALPRRPASVVAAGLFVLAGVAYAALGPFQVECDMASERCRDLWDAGALASEHAIHLWLGVAATPLLVGSVYAVSRALWASPAAAAALAAANAGFWLAVATWALLLTGDGVPDGLVQRLGPARSARVGGGRGRRPAAPHPAPAAAEPPDPAAAARLPRPRVVRRRRARAAAPVPGPLLRPAARCPPALDLDQ